jgi:hypothetical protein
MQVYDFFVVFFDLGDTQKDRWVYKCDAPFKRHILPWKWQEKKAAETHAGFGIAIFSS